MRAFAKEATAMVDPFRDVLLWASTNHVLAERLPRMAFVRATVRRFMPGEDASDAVAAAHDLQDHGVAAAFTMLGEGIRDVHQADAVVEHYVGLLDEIERRGLDAEISVKPTHLGYDLDPRVAAANLSKLAAHAQERSTRVWLDMESSAYVDGTIALYRDLVAAYPDSGICLQAYLHRTPQDAADLLQLGASIRFVKGAYREHPDVAIQDRASISATYRRLALATLRRKDPTRGRLVLGTHDVDLLRRIDADLRAGGRARDDVEVEMLFGIRAADQIALAREGFRVRTLIAYGTHWYPWFMRRLAERPANVLFAVRNVLARRTPA
jgi:proline dehydrogenase